MNARSLTRFTLACRLMVWRAIRKKRRPKGAAPPPCPVHIECFDCIVNISNRIKIFLVLTVASFLFDLNVSLRKATLLQNTMREFDSDSFLELLS